MRTPKVFVPQEPRIRDSHTGEFRPMYDISSASKFGSIVTLLPPGPMFFDTDAVVVAMREKLSDFRDDDFLMAIGDPAAIAVAALIAGQFNDGRITLLRYSKKDKIYIPSIFRT